MSLKHLVLIFIWTLGVSSHDVEFPDQVSDIHEINHIKTDSFFLETFKDKDNFSKVWTVSQAKKETEDGVTLKYDGDWILEPPTKDALPDDLGLTFKEKAKHRAISAKLFKTFVFNDSPLILQYEVMHQDGQECGGAYMKLISSERSEKSNFNDRTPYTIMFGPDKCGNTNRLHFIFRHKNPRNGSFEEKHCKPPKTRIDDTFTDARPHLFKLIIFPDNTFKMFVDHKIVNEGSLLEDFTPSVNPPQEIDDPSDKKPADWDDREKIYDSTAVKPEDWDETAPYQIPDPKAVKPENWLEDEPVNIRDPSSEKPDDWENEMDGEWEAPLVPNPACEDATGCGPWSSPMVNNPDYKGKWVPPLMTNPNYQGVWTPRKIRNPNFFEDKFPFKMSSIDSLGFELWSMSAKIMFDNILLTNDDNLATKFAELTYNRKMINIEKSADTMLNQFIAFTNRYPWLWALYLVILLIPITLIVVGCFWSNKDSDAEHKKDDDHPVDDETTLKQEEGLEQVVNTSTEGEVMTSTEGEVMASGDDERHLSNDDPGNSSVLQAPEPGSESDDAPSTEQAAALENNDDEFVYCAEDETTLKKRK